MHTGFSGAVALQMTRLQRKHDAELAERTQQLHARDEEAQQAKRAVKVAEEHVHNAKDAQQRLQVHFLGVLVRSPGMIHQLYNRNCLTCMCTCFVQACPESNH